MSKPTQERHLFVGADPDLHTPAIAMVDAAGQPVLLRVLSIPAKHKGYAAVEACVPLLCWCPFEVSDDTKLMFGRGYVLHGEIKAAAVEGQEIYRGVAKGKMKTGNPADLLNLAPVTGLLAMRIACAMNGARCAPWVVKPKTWKNGVPKRIHQARVFNRIGWKYTKKTQYCVADAVPAHVLHNVEKTSQWKHVGDAIGLALYARDRYYKENGYD